MLILWHAVVSRGFSSNAFLTFRQALELGGNVCKGATGTTVVYAHRFTPGDERRQAAEEGRTPGTIPFLKRFTVRSEEHTSELQSLMRISYAVFCLKKKTN